MIMKSSRGKPRFNYIYSSHRRPWSINTKLGTFSWTCQEILACFWFHKGAASRNESVNTSAISVYLILGARIFFQFIGDSLKCIDLWGGMFYLMGSLTIAPPCRSGCGQVEKIEEAHALRGPLSGHMLRSDLLLCVLLSVELLGHQLQPWVLNGRQRNVEIIQLSSDEDTGLESWPVVWTLPWTILCVDGEGTWKLTSPKSGSRVLSLHFNALEDDLSLLFLLLWVMDMPTERQVSLQFYCGCVSLICPLLSVLDSVDALLVFHPYWLYLLS